jgi:hypothetical protein
MTRGASAHEEVGKLEAEAHDLIARGHALLAKAARLRTARVQVHDDGDALVPLAQSGLAIRTRRKLEREGLLPVVKLGREKYTRSSALAALVPSTKPNINDPPLTAQSPREAARASYARGTSPQVGGGRNK